MKDCFLLIEKKVIGKIPANQAMLVLFASFYNFNVYYPTGCCNSYLLLECLMLNKKLPGRKPRLVLAALLADLKAKYVSRSTHLN